MSNKVGPDANSFTYWPDLVALINSEQNGGRMPSPTDTSFLTLFQPRSMTQPFSLRKGVIKANDTDWIEWHDYDEMANLQYPYGLSVPFVQNRSPYELFNEVEQQWNGLGFFYHRPHGTAAEPFRVSDYNRYWPNATNPMKILLPSRIAHTDIHAFENFGFSLAVTNWNNAIGIVDGLEAAQNFYAVPAGPPLWPSVNGTTGGWRSGVFMYTEGGDTLEGIYSIMAVAFGSFHLKGTLPNDPNETEFLSIFAGKDVKMLPILSNISTSVIPDDCVKVGIDDSEWLNTITYALPDGIVEVHIDSEDERELQEMYSRVRIYDFWGQYYDANKDSVFVKLIVEGEPDLIGFHGSPSRIKIGIFNDYGEEIASKEFLGKDLSTIQILTAQFDGNSFDGHHIEVWWDNKKQRSMRIREAI